MDFKKYDYLINNNFYVKSFLNFMTIRLNAIIWKQNCKFVS